MMDVTLKVKTKRSTSRSSAGGVKGKHDSAGVYKRRWAKEEKKRSKCQLTTRRAGTECLTLITSLWAKVKIYSHTQQEKEGHLPWSSSALGKLTLQVTYTPTTTHRWDAGGKSRRRADWIHLVCEITELCRHFSWSELIAVFYYRAY